MQCNTVIGLETHAQMLNAAHPCRTVTAWHQYVADA